MDFDLLKIIKSVLKINRKIRKNKSPISDWHGPFFRRLPDRRLQSGNVPQVAGEKQRPRMPLARNPGHQHLGRGGLAARIGAQLVYLAAKFLNGLPAGLAGGLGHAGRPGLAPRAPEHLGHLVKVRLDRRPFLQSLMPAVLAAEQPAIVIQYRFTRIGVRIHLDPTLNTEQA